MRRPTKASAAPSARINATKIGGYQCHDERRLEAGAASMLMFV